MKAPGTIKFYRGTTLITVKNSQLAGFEQILGLDNGASRDTLIAFALGSLLGSEIIFSAYRFTASTDSL
jgi:hypothetical protein